MGQMTSFGNYIKTEREKREWTQTELGTKIGINTSAICRIENGSQKFSKSKLKKLAELFQTDLQIVTDLFFADKFVRLQSLLSLSILSNCISVTFKPRGKMLRILLKSFQ